MFPFQKEVSSAAEMERLARETAEYLLDKGDRFFLLLKGSLGSGKTAFARGLKEPLGIDDNINSPTFNILNVYEGRKGILYHYDFYRIAGTQEIFEQGFEELWEKEEELPAVHAVEWWERISDILPQHIPSYEIEIRFSNSESETRIVTGKKHIHEPQ